MRYWLIKSEPNEYSIDDLAHDGTVAWEGVRNYQARNFMRGGMQVGDMVLFYHSSTAPTGVVGVVQVASVPHADMSQFNKKSDYYDPKAKRDAPIWACVDFSFVKKFKRVVTLESIKNDAHFKRMRLIQRGNRLSVMPVEGAEFHLIDVLGN